MMSLHAGDSFYSTVLKGTIRICEHSSQPNQGESHRLAADGKLKGEFFYHRAFLLFSPPPRMNDHATALRGLNLLTVLTEAARQNPNGSRFSCRALHQRHCSCTQRIRRQNSAHCGYRLLQQKHCLKISGWWLLRSNQKATPKAEKNKQKGLCEVHRSFRGRNARRFKSLADECQEILLTPVAIR